MDWTSVSVSIPNDGVRVLVTDGESQGVGLVQRVPFGMVVWTTWPWCPGVTHWMPLPALPRVELVAGRYRAPDGREGVVHGYDVFTACYTFEPDGFVPPAIIGPGIPDGRVQFGLEKAHLYVRIGGLPELRRSATIDFKGTP